MEGPERAAAVEYLRRKGTDAPAARLLSGLRTIFLKLEQTLERVPEAVRTQRPTPRSWSVHEIVDHLIASHRPAAAELRDLCAGVSPLGGPIPARLTSPDPFERPWPVLIEELKHTHAEVLAVVANADDAVPLVARAPFVMVVKMQGDSEPEVLEWVEALDWKAYAQALRVHTHEHLAQVERTVRALA